MSLTHWKLQASFTVTRCESDVLCPITPKVLKIQPDLINYTRHQSENHVIILFPSSLLSLWINLILLELYLFSYILDMFYTWIVMVWKSSISLYMFCSMCVSVTAKPLNKICFKFCPRPQDPANITYLNVYTRFAEITIVSHCSQNTNYQPDCLFNDFEQVGRLKYAFPWSQCISDELHSKFIGNCALAVSIRSGVDNMYAKILQLHFVNQNLDSFISMVKQLLRHFQIRIQMLFFELTLSQAGRFVCLTKQG